MNAKDAIKAALTSTENLLKWFVSDLSDADLRVRPVPAANHIAWQLGHLISSEQMMAGHLPGTDYPKLPAGFAERHANEAAASESPQGLVTKAEYLDLFGRTRAATLAVLGRLSEADLDAPTPGRMAQFAPTTGALLVLTANHTMMHAGQFTVVRRKLGKPVLF
jgi:hypothetical protein